MKNDSIQIVRATEAQQRNSFDVAFADEVQVFTPPRPEFR